MKTSLVAAPAVLLLTSLTLFADATPPTLRLPDTAAPRGYKAQLTLDPASKTFAGKIEIALQLRQRAKTIWLNGVKLTVQKASLRAANKVTEAKIIPNDAEFIGFEFPAEIPAGAGELTIEYSGQVRQQDSSGIFHMEDNGNSYLFTQFESTDARAAFPCFDEPSYKVPWQLTLDVPQGESAISNTSVVHEEARGGRKIIQFQTTKPLPSYLVAFAVGPLEFVDAGKAGKNQIPVRIVTPKGHADEATYAAEVTATIINRLENYFGIPFPYEKSDQVAIPVTFGFGAMENAGMVTYAQTIILAKKSADTEARRRSYATTAAHELAHQWFGDYVTTAWWNDIWLNEAFATWMEQKLIREWKPEWKTDIDDVDSKLFAEREDSLLSARKVRQEIVTKDDISNAFDGITYQKGAAVISMFESFLGGEEFRRGVQSYLKQYAFRNASAPDFLDSISTSSGKNINAAFSTFLNQAGAPLLSASLDCKETGASLHLTQERYLPLGSKSSAGEIWKIPVCVRYGQAGEGKNTQTACEVLSTASADVKLRGSGCPVWVQMNDKARGYYRVNYTPDLLSALSSGDVQNRLSAAERVDFMGNARSLVDAGKLPLDKSLHLVEVFHADPDLHVVESALNLAVQPQAHLVEQDLRPNFQRFIQKNFQQIARELGWKPAAGEDNERKLLRPLAVRAVATVGGDQDLAKEAIALTNAWFTNRSAVDPSVTAAVLGTAAYYGDKELANRFIEQLKNTKDRLERGRIIFAMRLFRDPQAIETNMQAVLSGSIPFIEGGPLIFSGQGEEATRTLGFEFLKAHFDEIASKRPTGGGFDAGTLFPNVGASFCNANQKSQLAAFFEPRVSQFSGAPRTLAQVLEGIDVCIAAKKMQEPGLQAFLKNY